MNVTPSVELVPLTRSLRSLPSPARGEGENQPPLRWPATPETALGPLAASRYLPPMRRILSLLFLTLAGCSNAPVAGPFAAT